MTGDDPEKKHRDEYGPAYQAHLLEQYKLYVELMDRVSARRHSTNTYFLSINTGLLTLLGAASVVGLKVVSPLWAACVAIAGVLLCYCWGRLVRSYKGLNAGKFEIIHALERELPVRLFVDEWEVLGEGKDPKRYKPFTEIEPFVPWVFGALYIALGVWGLVHSLGQGGGG